MGGESERGRKTECWRNGWGWRGGAHVMRCRAVGKEGVWGGITEMQRGGDSKGEVENEQEVE